MSDVPNDLKYTQTHEWVKLEDNSLIRVGISDFAQSELGDLVFIEFPKVGQQLEVGEKCAIVESVKAASDLFAPVSGIIVKINDEIADEPERVNDEPYDSWLFCIKADNIEELTTLMNADDYQKLTEDA